MINKLIRATQIAILVFYSAVRVSVGAIVTLLSGVLAVSAQTLLTSLEVLRAVLAKEPKPMSSPFKRGLESFLSILKEEVKDLMLLVEDIKANLEQYFKSKR